MSITLSMVLMCTIALPGIYINSNYYSLTDIIIPFVFLLYVITGKIHIVIKKRNLWLLVYVFICGLSLVFAMINSGDLYINSWLRYARLVNLLFVVHIVEVIYQNSIRCKKNIEHIIYSIMIFGSASSIVTLLLFFSQSTLFNPTQIMDFKGEIMYRASGIYGDAQTLGLIMSMIFIIAFVNVLEDGIKIISIVTMCLTASSIVLSDTRAAVIGIMFALAVYGIKKGRITKKSIAIVLGAIVTCIILYRVNPFFARVVNKRILPLFRIFVSKNLNDINFLSTNRFDIWSDNIKVFSNYSILQKIIGTGYKAGMVITDNSFIYALMSTGILGLISFVMYWIEVYKKYMFKKTYGLSIYICLFLCIEAVFLLTSDMMTLYRPMYLFMIFLELSACEKRQEMVRYK